MIKRILLVILLLFLAAASGLGLLLLAWLMDWSPWIAMAGPVIFLLLPFFWYLFRLGGSAVSRRRYAESVLGRGAGTAESASQDSALRRDWESGLLALRPPGRSLPKDLRRGGFPWLLAAGPYGSGSRGFLREAGPPLNPGPQAPLEGPEGCSWYFFEKAIYIAVRGLYDRFQPPAGAAAPGSQAGAAGSGAGAGPGPAPNPVVTAALGAGGSPGGAEETRAALCALLRETGRRIPLQGVLVTVPAEALRLEREEELRDLALQTGQLFDRLAEELDFSPPCYVFITGLHLEPGWEAALDTLAGQGRAAGALLAGGQGEGVAAEAAAAIRKEIQDLLVEVTDREPSEIARYLSAPAAAEALQRPLSLFCETLRSPAPGRAAPRILGVFVSMPQVFGEASQGAGPAGPEAPPGVIPGASAEVSAAVLAVAAAGLGRAGAAHAGRDGLPAPGGRGGLGAEGFEAWGAADKPLSGPAPAAAAPEGWAAAAGGDGPAHSPPGGRGSGAGPGRLLSETLPGLGRFSRRINRSGATRQSGIVWRTFLFYVALAAVACLFAKNVQYQRGANGEAQELRVALAAADAPVADPAEDLERADAAAYVLARLEDYEKSARVRGIGPDPAGELTRRMEEALKMSFEKVTVSIMSDIGRQLRRVSDPDSDLFAVTFRQLLFLFAAYSGRMDILSQGSMSSVEELFPVIPEGLDLDSRPLWNFTYARLLSILVARERGGPLAGDRSGRILAELNNAVDLAMELRGGASASWLLDWAERSHGVSDVEIAQFWEPFFSREEVEAFIPPGGLSRVRGACTSTGRAMILEALHLMEAAADPQRHPDSSEEIREEMRGFAEEYNGMCESQWREFQLTFSGPVARGLLEGSELSAFMRLRPVSPESPAARAAGVMLGNLRHLADQPDSPVWLENLQLGRMAGNLSGAKAQWRKAKGLLQKGKALGPMLRSARAQAGDLYYRTDFIRRVYEAEKEFSRYSAATQEIVSSLSGNPESALRLAAHNYGGQAAAAPPAGGAQAPDAPQDLTEAPFQEAKDSLEAYASHLYKEPGDTVPDDFIFRSRISEFEALKNVLVDTAARALDSHWESDVLLPTRFLTDSEEREALYGKDGLLLKFLSGRAAPFLDSKGPGGYSARTWESRPFPFSRDFLRLASVGSVPFKEPLAPSYDVTLTMTAALAGDEALEKPERTVVSLSAPDGAQTMINYNYPVTRVFTWKTGAEAEASLQISLPSVALLVTWDGPDGFPRFLRDLVTRNFELYPRDFPDHAEQLEALGIGRIRVLMKADGALPVINTLDLDRTPLPTSIVTVN
ncbi:MAG: hypothetical protein LBW85_10715 [Deltaproteobacteria bacterium]|jgi:hypothetical protein|nr:hypothetical protein [Deltaproteobacteria bacterium]